MSGTPPPDPKWTTAVREAWDAFFRSEHLRDLVVRGLWEDLMAIPLARLFGLYDEVRRLRKLLPREAAIAWAHDMRELEARFFITPELRRGLGLPDPPDGEG